MYNNPEKAEVQINLDATPSECGTYAALITGWTKPSKFEWDIVPNLLVKGHLYSQKAGVESLIRNLSHNPQVDRVYLLALTPFDLVSDSCVTAYGAIREKLPDVNCTVVFDYPIPVLKPVGVANHTPIVRPDRKVPQFAQTYNLPLHYYGTTLVDIHASMVQNILQYGKHYANRQFYALSTQVANVDLMFMPTPEYHPYFEQWLTPVDKASLPVSYTYGRRILGNLDHLRGDWDSTQKVITLLQSQDYVKGNGMPCLVLLQYFDTTLVATFRSHDIGSAWVKNVEALIYCGRKWFPELTHIVTVSNNAHVYDWDAPRFKKGFNADPRGSFTLQVESNKYVLYLNEEPVIEASSKGALRRKICDKYPQMPTAHAMYLEKVIS